MGAGLAPVTHPYSTKGEVVRQVAAGYNRRCGKSLEERPYGGDLNPGRDR